MHRTDPWQVDDSLFPADADAADRLAFCVRYAILAPSSHNSQPWIFEIRRDRVRIHADRSRRLPVADPCDRELTISCGAALFALRVAMRRFGMADRTNILPNDYEPDVLAEVLIAGPHVPTPVDNAFCRAIPQRHTNRHAFTPDPVGRELLGELAADAAAEGVWLHALTDGPMKHQVADLIARADVRQFHDAHFREELSRWVRPNLVHTDDGMPAASHGMEGVLWDLLSYAGPWMIRSFDQGDGISAKDRALADGSPAIVVIGTRHDSPAEWVRAGQALMRVLLRARCAHVWASYLNQPVEVAEYRTLLNYMLGEHSYPQLILRMGYGPDPVATPRRAAGEVIRR